MNEINVVLSREIEKNVFKRRLGEVAEHKDANFSVRLVSKLNNACR